LELSGIIPFNKGGKDINQNLTKSCIDVSIIIISWNTRDLLAQCLQSLQQAIQNIQAEIIVVDNASKDASAQYVANHFPDVCLIRNDCNRGFAAANNQGYAVSKGRCILFLNPDTIVHKGSLQSMVHLLDSEDKMGACSCRLLNSDGSVQPNVRHFPSFRAMLQRYTIFKYFGLFESARAFYRMRGFAYNNKAAEVDQVMGAALMVKRAVLQKVGTMDEKLYLYFEETDLCYRIKQAGFRVYFTPDGEITHLARASSSLLGSDKVQAMFFKSLFYYFRKHKGKGKTLVFSCVFKPGVCLYLLCEIFVGLFCGIGSWCLKLDENKVKRRFERARESALFLIRYGYSFLLST